MSNINETHPLISINSSHYDYGASKERDLELGIEPEEYFRESGDYLSTQDARKSLAKKISLLSKYTIQTEKCLDNSSTFASICGLASFCSCGTGLVLTFAGVQHYGIPFYLGCGGFLGGCILPLVCVSFMGCEHLVKKFNGYLISSPVKRKMNALNLEQSDTEPLSGEVFCQIQDQINPEEIQKLSFDQIREIKSINKNAFEAFFQNEHLSESQKNPWQRLSLLESETIEALLEDDILAKYIVNTPGFFEEFLHRVPEEFLNQEMFYEFIRPFVDNKYGIDYDNKTLYEATVRIYDGESVDYAFLSANEKDFVTLQLPSGLSETISCKFLREKSEYFHSLLTPITDEEGPSSWKESSGRDITLENISDDAFIEMMKLLKGMKPKITEKNCLELLELAQCYQINELNRMTIVPAKREAEKLIVQGKTSILNQFPSAYLLISDKKKFENYDFSQLNDVRKRTPEVFKRLFKEGFLTKEQKIPWVKLSLLRKAKISEISEFLDDEVIKINLKNTPDFMEEFIRALPAKLFESDGLTKKLRHLLRPIVEKRYSEKYTRLTLNKTIHRIREGENVNYSFKTATEINFVNFVSSSGKKVSISTKILKQKSEKLSESECITLKGVSDYAFNQIIRYLKGDKLFIEKEKQSEVFDAAENYDIPGLVDFLQEDI